MLTGGHTLSGACIEPRSLEELFPNWREMGVCKKKFFSKFEKSRTEDMI
jgi:flavin-dependent dehydrogenase